MGTLTLPPYFNLQEDCKDLRSSFKGIKGINAGLGCNEKKVIEILGKRTQAQRLEIAQAYQTVYGESLHKRLKAAFSGKLEVSFTSHHLSTILSPVHNYLYTFLHAFEIGPIVDIVDDRQFGEAWLF